MIEVNLNAKARQLGKNSAKRLRREGLIPGIFYIKGEDPIPFSTDLLSVRPIVYTSQKKIVKLQVEGKSQVHDCVLKDITFDPVTDKITHIDLFGITGGKKITIEVPILLKGSAIGVREGGVMQQAVRKVNVRCLPVFMPNAIEMDVTNLGIGKSLTFKDVKIEHVEFEIPPETVICTIAVPRVKAKADEK